MEYKQVILVRKDLKLSPGKMSAQAAHASSEALLKSHKDDISKWRKDGMKKAVLEVNSKEDLFKYKQQAQDAGLVVSLITDAGRTEVEPGTITCLGIGPDKEEKIDKITGKLKLLS
ncbi:peptidyl-tRNA hydrolase [Candidatus Woesearchaeota archaeon]|nr:peptidyl-tRNA hydrolase [Candidatus Woesearchaeota archaeon]